MLASVLNNVDRWFRIWAAQRILRGLGAACLVALGVAGAGAADFTWIGGSFFRPDDWTTNANWENGADPPTNGVNTDVFMKGPGGDSDANGAYHIDSLTFHSAATGSWTVGGNAIIVDNFIRNNDSNTHRFIRSIELGDQSLTIDAAAGELEFSSGSGGSIHFTQNNSTLTVIGGESVFFNNGFTREAFVTTAHVAIDEGTLVQLGSNSSAVTRWNVLDGTLRVASSSVLAADTTVDLSADGTLDLNGNITTIGLLTGSGHVDLGGAATLTVGQSGNSTFSGVISGTGFLTKTGSGTFTLSGVNTYTAATFIEEGTLRLGLGGSLASGASLVFAPGGTFDLNGTSAATGALVSQAAGAGTVRLAGATLTVTPTFSHDFSGNIQGPGTLVKNGGQTLGLLGTNNTFSTLQINGGVVEVDNAGALGTGNIVIGNAVLQSTATLTRGRPIVLNSSASRISVDSGATFTQSGVISGSGSLNKNGVGTLELAASNSYSGDTFVNVGTLRLGAANRIANSSDVVLLPGATLDMNNFSDTVASLSGTGAVQTGASGALTVNASAGTFTFGGQLLGGGFINKSGNHTLVLSGASPLTGTMNVLDGTLRFTGAGSLHESTNVTVSTGATWDLNGASDTVGTISGGGSIDLESATLTVAENGSATRTFSGVISGFGSLVKDGSHTLVLSGNNAYTGTTRLNGGVLRVASSDNFGAGPLEFNTGFLNTTASFTNSRPLVINASNGAPLDVNASTTLTQTGTIFGSTSTFLFKGGDGTLMLQGNNAETFSGDVIVAGGTLELGPGDVLGNSTTVTLIDGATLLVTQSEGFGLIGGGLTGDGDVVIAAGQVLEVGYNNAVAAFGGDFSGGGSFHKVGTGIYTLSGNLTYGGATSVNAGTLRRSGGSGLPDTTDLHVAAGAVYDLNNASDAIDALTGGGSVTLGTALVFKTLTIGSAGGGGTFSGVISGNLAHLAKTGAGTQVLTGNNTYSQTFFNGGVLSTGSNANLGSGQLNFNGGTWQVTGSFTNSRNIAIGGASSGTIEVPLTQTLTHTGSVSGILVTLNKTGHGTLVLSGSASPATMNINAGVLRLSGGSGLAASTKVNVADGAAWDLNGVNDAVATIAGAGGILLNDLAQLTVGGSTGSTTFSGVISGSGVLVKAGSHQLTLSGANTYSGDTIINGGTLLVNANVDSALVTVNAGGVLGGDGTVLSLVNEGRVSPGNSAGALQVVGDFTQQIGGMLDIELGGLLPGVEHDQLVVAGTASLAGTLDVSLLDAFTPAAGDAFEILTAEGGIAGTFSDEQLPLLTGDLFWDVIYGPNSVVLEVAAPILAGDYNQNGIVDAADYTVWRDRLGGDFTPADYGVWKQNFGASLGSASTARSNAVPEPASLSLFAIALAAGMILGLPRFGRVSPAG